MSAKKKPAASTNTSTRNVLITAGATVIVALIAGFFQLRSSNDRNDALATSEALARQLTQVATVQATAASTTTNAPAPTGTLLPTDTPVPEPSETPTASSQETGARITTICDSFDDNQLIENNWILDGDEAQLIYLQDGVLHFDIPEGQSAGGNQDKWVWWRTENKPVPEITFIFTLLNANDESVGTRIETFLEDGRELSASFGSGPNGPELEFSFCPLDFSGQCSGYGDYDHPDPVNKAIEINVPIFVRVTQEDGAVMFYTDNMLQGQASTNQSIADSRLNLHGDTGSVFHATVDDFCVSYLEN